jgi:hypothetical protein
VSGDFGMILGTARSAGKALGKMAFLCSLSYGRGRRGASEV